MKNLIMVLLAIMIFGPNIDVHDKKGQLRFTYTGIMYGAIQFIYWIVDKITKRFDD